MTRRLGILISGRGSNLQSIIDAIRAGELDATIAVVVSNRPEAAGLLRAREAGLETVCLQQRDFDGRDAYDTAVAALLRARGVDLVCLAGFMRVVGPGLLDRFPNRHIGFSAGIHRCVGARLAELQVGILMEEMAKRRMRVNLIGEPERVSACFVHGYRQMPDGLVRVVGVKLK